MSVKKYVRADYVACDEEGGFGFSDIPSAYGATKRYVTYGGAPVVIAAGEIHYSRVDKESWARELAKMKAQGLNSVSAYAFWNHHERKKGVFDFTGNKDVTAFIRACKDAGLKVILRIGPWCHGEARRGGFPDYLAFVPAKRRSSPLYMRYVKRFWRALAERVKEFTDGATIIGIQLENEYNGDIRHIARLRELAEEVGFRAPFYTMTAWPTNTPDKRFLPMFGGYPEAPWTQNKKPLPPAGRFAIVSGRSETTIGEDLLGKSARATEGFEDFPYATCEIGTGNQVTHHRRPVISERDGYGVAFAKLASGANWLGYYMYHGGRNPTDRPMQESRRTFYPNDYPIADYDFRAPISKDGAVRAHAHRLRLMHYFLAQNGASFARTQAFFSEDRAMPYFSYRCDESRGYVFLSNYERGAGSKDETVDVTADAPFGRIEIKGLKIKAGEMFFFPAGAVYGGIAFDYITAQPIIETVEDGDAHVYFIRYGETRICAGGKEKSCVNGTEVCSDGDKKVYLHFLDERKAKELYVIGGKAVFSEFPVFGENGKYYAECLSEITDGLVTLKERSACRLKYSSYMFTSGRRRYYELTFDASVFDGADDVEITIPFKGLDLQMFADGELVDDCFNTDGKFIFRLKRIARKAGETKLVLRVAAATARGRGSVYNEIGILPGEAELFAPEARRIYIKELGL